MAFLQRGGVKEGSGGAAGHSLQQGSMLCSGAARQRVQGYTERCGCSLPPPLPAVLSPRAWALRLPTPIPPPPSTCPAAGATG